MNTHFMEYMGTWKQHLFYKGTKTQTRLKAIINAEK